MIPSGGSAWASACRSAASTPVAVPCPRTTVARSLPSVGNQSRRALPTGVGTNRSSICCSCGGDVHAVGHEINNPRRDRRVVGDNVSCAVLVNERLGEAFGQQQ